MRKYAILCALVAFLFIASPAKAGNRIAIATSNGFCGPVVVQQQVPFVPQGQGFAAAGRGFAVAGNGGANVAISQRRGFFPIFPLFGRNQNIAISNGNVAISGR